MTFSIGVVGYVVLFMDWKDIPTPFDPVRHFPNPIYPTCCHSWSNLSSRFVRGFSVSSASSPRTLRGSAWLVNLLHPRPLSRQASNDLSMVRLLLPPLPSCIITVPSSGVWRWIPGNK